MTRHPIALGAALCIALATSVMVVVALDWDRAAGDRSARTAEASPGSVVTSAAALAEPVPPAARSAVVAEPATRRDGALEVLVMRAGVRHVGAEVRAYLRQRAEGHTGTARWSLAAAATTGADGVASI